MDFVLQKHGARHIYVVPEGLRELMLDVSREILRNQPEHVFCYIADYLDAMLITRENAQIASRVVEELAKCSEITSNFLISKHMTKEEANANAKIIQRAFRQHLARKQFCDKENNRVNILENLLIGINLEQAEHSACVIQNAYRKYKSNQQDQSIQSWRPAMHFAMNVYNQCGVSKDEIEKSARIIQSAYRGYYARKIYKESKIADKIIGVPSFERITQLSQTTILYNAVVLIQTTFRRFRAMNMLEELNNSK